MKVEIDRFRIPAGIFLLLYLLVTHPEAVGTERIDSLRFRLVGSYLIVVPVQVNRGLLVDFLLDTGTTTTIIAPEIANQLKARPVDRVNLVTIAGSTVIPRTYLTQLALNHRTTDNVETLIGDLPELSKLDNRIGGILGQNFLTQFNYLIDYRKRLISFVDDVEVQFAGTRLEVAESEGKRILTTGITEPGQKGLRLVIDSAVSGLVLFASGCRKLQIGIEPGEADSSEVTTNAGKALARTAVIRKLRIGTETLSSLGVRLLQTQEADDRAMEDGLLPTSLFRSIFFNNREGYVILNCRN